MGKVREDARGIVYEMVVGFVCSAFDLLHAGHIMMLRAAKERCNYLIAGLHIDPSIENSQKNKPLQSIVERYVQLAAVKYVNKIIPYQTERDLIDIMHLFKIDVRFLGEEYREKEITGKEIVKICYLPRNHRFSTSELRCRINGGKL
jgi:glycerol-3-phosphate cytidylyltransferase